MTLTPEQITRQWQQGQALSRDHALALASVPLSPPLLEAASVLRDTGFPHAVTYSRKVFIPLTHLCRDVCHYCTFAKTPRHLEKPYLSPDDVVALARQGAAQGCKEALFTLGEKPELRYRVARDALAEMGFATTLEYVAHVAGRVLAETGLLPHINAGCMTDEEIAFLRPVSASMGIMLESASDRLCEPGMPHYGSPDKIPAVRLQTLERAGQAKVPFTSGILIGIGETRQERIESLLALRDVHQRHGHVQEIIVQNFRAKADTLMRESPEPDLDEMLWTLAIARLVFGPAMSIQAPPNLSPGVLPKLVSAGINDWGGVSPVTPDFVNPEAPWPHLDKLAAETAQAGKVLVERLTVYPAYGRDRKQWVDAGVIPALQALSDAEGLARDDQWHAGAVLPPPKKLLDVLQKSPVHVGADLPAILQKAEAGERLDEQEVVRLFAARGDEIAAVCQAADRLRQSVNGDCVSYVVNRNINYTNICYFKCRFCAFSKGKVSENLREKPYDISMEEIQRRTLEAWERGATEVCLQGGIHPDYTGQHYLDVCEAIRAVCPSMHIHAFSPLEITQGATTLGLSLPEFLAQLKAAGLNTLPGTAAEILDDEVRAVICPDKISTDEWFDVMRAAHQQGIRSTITIMFGHVESPLHWARHLLRVRDLQAETGGFTEFVPLPFVHMESPQGLRKISRKGPTFREVLLMHAIGRLVLHPLVKNIQASWVKLGAEGVSACLSAGVNDLGGTLMNESITRAAGAAHGQEFSPEYLEGLMDAAGRSHRQRTTLYGTPEASRMARSYGAAPVQPIDEVGQPAPGLRLIHSA
ncbi:MAG: 7,8-didemethyl-8-hydroxy-5-deazariboflavin synthase subunit CofH [Gammaproteobacteria bacterium]|nr:MAG: 7,8-didemethyl-8-hydroxy-5-deazariboflavin synthase subunit CofH [Gammaproteobacteria bacterium]